MGCVEHTLKCIRRKRIKQNVCLRFGTILDFLLGYQYTNFLCFRCTLSSTPPYDYGQVLEYSLLFYEAQRSGKLPSDNRIPYRGDSAMNDGQSEGHDLTGGYYDGTY